MVGLDAQQKLNTWRSTDLANWTEPQALDTHGEPISADGENRPKIAFGPQGQVVISYTRPLDKPYTGWIRMLRSSDGGASFKAEVRADRLALTALTQGTGGLPVFFSRRGIVRP